MKTAIENCKLKFMTELVKRQLFQEGIKRLFGRIAAALHVGARNSSKVQAGCGCPGPDHEQ